MNYIPTGTLATLGYQREGPKAPSGASGGREEEPV